MVPLLSRRLACLALVLSASVPAAAAADLDVYRDFRIGATAADIVAQVDGAARDVKTLHDRGSLLQELVWRPPYVSARAAAERDSVREIVFSFVDDRLFRMAVEYDSGRTEGLTGDDMRALLTSTYGNPSPVAAQAARRPGYDSLDAPVVIAEWRHADTRVTLHHSTYRGSFNLVILSVPLELQASEAEAAALVMDAREAPAREAARLKAQADAEETIRATNKAAFQP